MPEQNKFYVTTPIYYVNAKPHLGSLYSTLLADVAARYAQLEGKKTFLLTGTDEHGQKIAQAAQAAGKEPKAFVDSFIESFKGTWDLFNIGYNYFVRTTEPAHIKAVQAWIIDLQKKGDIYKGFYEGYYCTSCEAYVTEKDMVAGHEGAPNCPNCGRQTTLVKEESYFFKLSAYQDKLLQFYEKHPEFVTPRERISEVVSFVKAGLKDLAISRTTISWGIPFPGDAKHVCYVWADALNNYLSAVGYADPARTKDFNFWWPADLQVLGKDIIRFHAVYWPAFLMAAGLAVPRTLLVHGWIKMGNEKMSKSLGNVVDPQELYKTYGADAIRYYLVRHLAVTHDAPFTQDDLVTKINADLVHDLSNLLHRMLTLATANGAHKLSAPVDREIQQEAAAMLAEFEREMQAYMYHRAYAAVWKFIHSVNAYFHKAEPWKKKDNKPEFETIMATTAYGLYIVAHAVWPVMPGSMDALLQALGVKRGALAALKHDKPVFTLTAREPLFKTVEKIMVEEKKEVSNHITIDDFAKVELLVGTITKIEIVPKSDKLYALTVDLGPVGIRQVLSGVRAHFAEAELLNKQGVFVANLAPRKMVGLESQGMMLFAKDTQGKLQMVTVGAPVPNGSRLS